MLEIDGLVACICEGSAEQAIMDILLENNLLVFKELLDDKIIMTRSASVFEAKYLRKDFEKQLTIVRILDSKTDKFKLSKLYKEKIKVINIITSPEIEMLIIHNENKYNDFKKFQTKNNMKPSEYCKIKLKYQNVKTYDFVKSYFSNISNLLKAINEHKKVSKTAKTKYSLYDILLTKF